MLRIPLMLMALLGIAPPAFSASQSALEKSLELWKPTSISIQKGRMTVVTRQRQVTDDIYQAMIAGACMAELSAPGALDGITEITIANAFSKQGYVFEGGRKECHELNAMPIGKTKLWILGKTHWL